jgi:hypothetical protein
MHLATNRDFQRNRRTALMFLAAALWIAALSMAWTANFGYHRSYGHGDSDLVPRSSTRHA